MKRKPFKRGKWKETGTVYLRYSFYLFLLAFLLKCYENYLYENAAVTNLWNNAMESSEFRAMILSEDSISAIWRLQKEDSFDIGKCIMIWMLDHDYDLTNSKFGLETSKDYSESYCRKERRRKRQLEQLLAAYEAVWKDVRYFPVPISKTNEQAKVAYENSWLAERTYGGTRGHEGTDLIASINQRGYYPVLSITDGTVEQVGWLNKGGWRIGIRAEHGAYFYYAHLYQYAKNYRAGDAVKAGEFLGYMGDSGYSNIVGTTGKFDVHLHIGIYIKTPNEKELSVNPYWVLRFLDKNRLTYSY